MMLIRPVRESDLDDIYLLSTVATEGLTTLPVSREKLESRIALSLASFRRKVEQPDGESYFLVMEDLARGKVIGTTGVVAAVGLERPFYNAVIRFEHHTSREPEVKTKVRVLHPGTPYKGACELATLFLHPDYRHSGNGALLSKSRYLLFAAWPDRFAETVIAEIRGWVDKHNHSPFWDAVGRKFFQMDLVVADRINSMGNWQFIRDLYPRRPIYLDLLPKAAQDVIAKPHDESAAAARLLESEGFAFNNVVDIFDAGPCLEARRGEIRAVRESRKAKLAAAAKGTAPGRFLVARTGLADFRVVQCGVQDKGKGRIAIPKEAMEALELGAGADVRYVALKQANSRKK